MSPEERVEIIKENRGYWSCLRIGNRVVDCKFWQKCGLEDYEKYYHQRLHEAHVSRIMFHNDFTNENDSSEACLPQLMKMESVTNPSRNLSMLWNDGPTISLITFATVKQLNLKREQTNISTITVGCTKENIASYLYQLPLKDKYYFVLNCKGYNKMH